MSLSPQAPAASGIRVPSAVSGDPADVTVALEVSSALWEKGDEEEAVRWLRRAVDAAGEAGDASRAAALADAAAELEKKADERKRRSVRPVPSSPSPSAGLRVSDGSGAPALSREVRVSVKPSVRDPSLLVVRPLRDGQSPPHGAREGWLRLGDDESGVHESSAHGAGTGSTSS